MSKGTLIILGFAVVEGFLLALVLWVILPELIWTPPLWFSGGVYGLWLAYEFLTFGPKRDALDQNPITGSARLMNARGITLTPLSPDGQVRVGHEIWRAQCENHMLPSNTPIRVIQRRGTLLIVKAAGD